MDRKEIYTQIKALGLEGEVKNRFGRNFTQVATADLEELINSNSVTKSTFYTELQEKYNKAVKVIAKFLADIPEEILKDVNKVSETIATKTISFEDADIEALFNE